MAMVFQLERAGGDSKIGEVDGESERVRELQVNREVCQWRSSSSSSGVECIV